MKTNEIMKYVSRTVGRAGLKLKKHSPEILVISGVAGMVGAAVMACKATTKLESVLEETKTQVDNVHKVLADETVSKKVYSEEDGKKDLTIIYAQTGVKLAKMYAPAIAVGTLSAVCIFSSHRILKKRNVALAAAYTAVEKSFKEYRERVVDRFGKDLDRELKYNIKAKEIQESVTDENGEEKTVTKNVKAVDDMGYSAYAKIFDEFCAGWNKDPELNLMFIRRVQDQANEKLKSQGHLFLNDVYKMLGFKPTKVGQVVGWIYNEKNPVGDNYIDFGLYDIFKVNPVAAERKSAFVNGYEYSVILDFNVDGNILDLI